MIPFFSIIVPVYNVENYLEECLESILSQDCDDYEVLCIDDGSTDASPEISARYNGQYERLFVITQKNSGLSMARNKGMQNASGKYILFVDSDDMLESGSLATLKACAADSNAQIISFNTSRIIYEDGICRDLGKEAYYNVTGDYPGIRPGREFLVELLANNDFVESACLMLINRQWLCEQGLTFVKGAYYEDSVFALDCYLRSVCMVHLTAGLYVYRVRKNSIMTKKYTPAHARWRLWQLEQCLKRIFIDAGNERERAALAKFAKQIMGNIKGIYAELDDANRDEMIGSGAVPRLLAECLDLAASGIYNADLEAEGLLSRIKQSDSVLLYGAGLVGDKVFYVLQKSGYAGKICGYVTTNAPEFSVKNGCQVRCLDEYNPDNIDLLLVASSRYQEEMLRSARHCSFQNILVVTYGIEHTLDKWLSYEG